MTGLRKSFGRLRRALEEAEIPFAIGGSWASAVYGDPRQTNDIDLVALLSRARVLRFFELLGGGFHADAGSAIEALQYGRPFNLIDHDVLYKYDIFPVTSDYGLLQIERSQRILIPSLDENPVPVVSAEDIVLAKLRWYRDGGEGSERQWRDILGVLAGESASLDFDYLTEQAKNLGLDLLLRRAREANP